MQTNRKNAIDRDAFRRWMAHQPEAPIEFWKCTTRRVETMGELSGLQALWQSRPKAAAPSSQEEEK